MLEYKLENDILTITETIIHWDETIKRFWIYDTVNWIKNANGKQNEELTEKMSERSIEWVKKFHLSKLEQQ